MHDKADAILVLIAIPLPRRFGRPKSDEGGSKAKTGLPRRSLAKAGPASCFTLQVPRFMSKNCWDAIRAAEKVLFPGNKKCSFCDFFYAGWMSRGFKNTFNHE
jgi:hypothetical protein